MDHAIVLFDGVCNLCSSTVQFIIKRDRRKQFRFASLQGEVAQALLKPLHIQNDQLSTIILIDAGKAYTRSGAVLRILKKLGGGWSLLYGFIIVPPFIRDAVYNWVARNRYKWYGKKDACWIPTPDLRARFLDQGTVNN